MERNCPQCGNILSSGSRICALCGAEIRSSSPGMEQLLIDGRKIEAIKLYREENGVGLKEAKDAVEEIQQRLRAQGRLPQGSGRGCVLLLVGTLSWMVAAVLVCALVW